jgi:hypothetical protein
MAAESIDGTRGVQPAGKGNLVKQIADFLLKLASEIPESREPHAADATTRDLELISHAALRAAAVSGALALPPGPLGIATILPDLYAIWRIQAKLVADIAAANGKSAYLTQETMLYCLFKHMAAQAIRDIAVRAGERVLVRRVSLRAMQKTALAIGGKVTQRVIQKAVSRWLPIVGAIGVGAYAYYDTGQVGQTAADYFRQDLGDGTVPARTLK